MYLFCCRLNEYHLLVLHRLRLLFEVAAHPLPLFLCTLTPSHLIGPSTLYVALWKVLSIAIDQTDPLGIVSSSFIGHCVFWDVFSGILIGPIAATACLSHCCSSTSDVTLCNKIPNNDNMFLCPWKIASLINADSHWLLILYLRCVRFNPQYMDSPLCLSQCPWTHSLKWKKMF